MGEVAVVHDVTSRYRGRGWMTSQSAECFTPNSGGNTDKLFALSLKGSGRFYFANEPVSVGVDVHINPENY